MTFNTNEELIERASSLRNMPSPAVTLMRTVVNQQLQKGNSEATSIKVGWEVVKTKFHKVEDKWVARDGAFDEVDYYTFEANPADSFITRDANGAEIHNYILSDTMPDRFGTSPTEELLNEWASWINQHQPEVDTDHELFYKAKETFGPTEIEKVASLVAAKKGISKAIRAVVKDSRLIVSLAFDARYKNHVDKIKGLSIEAAAVTDKLTGKMKKGKLLGLTHIVNKDLGNPRAVRYA